MKAEKRTYLLFKGTSHVMRAEKVLIRAGIPCRLVPVPRTLSSQCGVCLRLTEPNVKPALRELESGGIELEDVHTEQ
ncbi:MAG: DUF3343 domain-containing protein [Chitinivibrionales bacterium]|nr:DUF3343 domain-containing protein [Chitinivibrionales bacterium]